MADVSYFVKPRSWKVTGGSGPVTEYLPATGSVRIVAQKNGSPETYRVIPLGRSSSKPWEGFKHSNGRLECPLDDSRLLVIEQGKNSGGKVRLSARVERRAGAKSVRVKPGLDMSGTWGAETNPPPGSGGRT